MKEFIGLLIIAVLLGCAGEADLTDLKQDELHYCEMVHLFNRTGGIAGWADYKGIYDETCTSSISVSVADSGK